jgi:hypothetical protein
MAFGDLVIAFGLLILIPAASRFRGAVFFCLSRKSHKSLLTGGCFIPSGIKT